ncbi:hypothetical protein EYF80_048832 [Liparis tanakae]|uniref:Uncharacterized protein n=1 Tax=Liparis tanakae TaxID=230148 RepID=A0A4Z2FIH2_9TELE|nr:hypothetical protein EYF80_048832 [Liparis tanakae]
MPLSEGPRRRAGGPELRETCAPDGWSSSVFRAASRTPPVTPLTRRSGAEKWAMPANELWPPAPSRPSSLIELAAPQRFYFLLPRDSRFIDPVNDGSDAVDGGWMDCRRALDSFSSLNPPLEQRGSVRVTGGDPHDCVSPALHTRARTPPTAPPVRRSTETTRRRFRGLRDHQEEVQGTQRPPGGGSEASETTRRRFRGLRDHQEELQRPPGSGADDVTLKEPVRLSLGGVTPSGL